VELENIATPPPEQAPELRCASLHRAVERGLASDEVWFDLAQVCLTLGHDSEAVRAFRNMADGALKNSLQSILARRALIDPPVRRSRRSADSVTAIAAPRRGPAVQEAHTVGLQDHAVDAMQFLLIDRMPLYVLVTTLAFPLVVGLGGFLTAGGSPYLLPAIAALPGLAVLGIVGTLARRILVESSYGAEDPPPLPDLATLAHQSIRFLFDFACIAALLLGAPVSLLFVGVPAAASLPAVLLGLLLLPMALALRQVRDDWRALLPTVLFPAINRCGAAYLGIAGVFWAVFLPAAAAFMATLGSAVWLQIAVVGPLLATPLFMVARMLGTFLDAHRIPLGSLLASRTPRPVPQETTIVNRQAEAPRRQRMPERPPQIAHYEHTTEPHHGAQPGSRGRRPAPGVRPAAGPAPARRGQQRQGQSAPQPRPASPRPAQQHSAQRRPAPAAGSGPRPEPAARPERQPAPRPVADQQPTVTRRR
jgi:hypothetical protein